MVTDAVHIHRLTKVSVHQICQIRNTEWEAIKKEREAGTYGYFSGMVG